MSSEQFPLVLQPVPDGEATAADWTPGSDRARRCATCDRHVTPRYRTVLGVEDCPHCGVTFGDAAGDRR
jgi:ribosomal protein L37AE/L43A